MSLFCLCILLAVDTHTRYFTDVDTRSKVKMVSFPSESHAPFGMNNGYAPSASLSFSPSACRRCQVEGCDVKVLDCGCLFHAVRESLSFQSRKLHCDVSRWNPSQDSFPHCMKPIRNPGQCLLSLSNNVFCFFFPWHSVAFKSWRIRSFRCVRAAARTCGLFF